MNLGERKISKSIKEEYPKLVFPFASMTCIDKSHQILMFQFSI